MVHTPIVADCIPQGFIIFVREALTGHSLTCSP